MSSDVKLNQNAEDCEECQLGKAKKLPHREKEQQIINEERASGSRKGVIHSDLMGPVKSSLGGCQYVLTYICSQTEYSTVYLLKNKSEQFSFFKEFRAEYEKQNDVKLKELRSDNGLEYCSNEFQTYLKVAGIKHRTSVAYVPQANGKAERLNRTLLEKARTMLSTAQLSTYMWGSAILTANYLRNRSPCSAINFKTPYEMKFKKLPTLNHLKVFGCKAYPLILNKKRTKFDPTALANCVMVGYDDSNGIYWIFDKSNRKLFRSRDVTFNEDMKLTKSILKDNNEDYVTMSYQDDDKAMLAESDIESDHEEDNLTEDDQTEAEPEIVQEPVQENMTIRKSSRATKQPDRLVIDPKNKTYAITNSENLSDPQTLKQALQSSNREEWKNAIQSELDSIKENEVWSVVERPNDKTVIGSKWLFKIKRNSRNEPEKFKARLVAKGYDQKYGIDYYETFAPVVKIQTLRTIFAIAANCGLFVHQIDIATAFLNGTLEEEIYIEPPPGSNFKENHVCKLKKSLYGLKQAPRSWNSTLVKFLQEYGLSQCKSDVCVFINNHLIVAIYVDDIIIACKYIEYINDFKTKISERFKTKDLGQANFVLKIKVENTQDGGWKLHQHAYIDDLIQFYQLNNEKPIEIPILPTHKLTTDLNEEKEPLRELVDITQYRQAIGKLMYLMVCTRPDICYAVSVLSRFMSKPREKHWRYLKQLLKYVKTTRDYALIYPNANSTVLTGYSDSDHAGDLGDRKSTSGFIFMLGGCTVSWKCTKQKTVAISSTEAEYIGLSEATQEAIWFKEVLSELKAPQKQITMCGDNLSSMHIVKNAYSHNRSKHIDVRFHFIRDHYQNGNISLQYVESENLCADFLTKGVNKIKHYKCMKQINLSQN